MKRIAVIIVVTLILTGVLIPFIGMGTVSAEIENSSWVYGKNILSEESTIYDTEVSSDGSKVYIVGSGSNAIHSYDLSDPYNLSTGTYSSTFSFSFIGVRALAFNEDGTKFFVTTADEVVYQFELSTAWDITTATQTKSFNFASNTAYGPGVEFNNDGSVMYLTDQTNGQIDQYALSTAYEVDTATYNGNGDISGETGTSYGPVFNGDGTKMYVPERNKQIEEYDLSTPFDVTTITYSNNQKDTSANINTLRGMSIGNSGKKLYAADSDQNMVHEYNMNASGYSNTVTGKVYDQETSNAISGVNITVRDNSTGDIAATTTTGTDGNYSVSLDEGAYNFTYEHDSYIISKWTDIPVNDDKTLDMSLGRLYIKGTVKDGNNAIEGATIEIYNGTGQLYNKTKTSSNGEYQVWVYDDTWEVYVSHKDYFNQNETGIVLDNETSSYDSSFSLREKPEEELYLIVNSFIEANETVPYRIEYVKNGNLKRVTNQATINVDNSSVLEIDRTNNTITGLNVNDTTNITVTYQGIESLNDTEEITVATVNIENIGLLPLSYKISALLWDRTAQVIFIATFAGLGMSRIMQSGGFGAGRANNQNPWILLGICFMIILLGGVREYISNGIVFSAFFYVALASMLMKGVNKDQVNVVNEGGFEE